MIERKNGDFFAAIPDIKAREKAFLDYVAEFYNLNNRAETPSGGCVYRALENSPGCAIGQFLPVELQRKCYGSITDIYYYRPEEFNHFPDWMQEMSIDFLLEVQQLHDVTPYWSETGISEYGRQKYASIAKRYNLI